MASRPARFAPAADTTGLPMKREPATALARAASAAVADVAGTIVAGMFDVVFALERACLNDEKVRERMRAGEERVLASRQILSIRVERDSTHSTKEKARERRVDVAF